MKSKTLLALGAVAVVGYIIMQNQSAGSYGGQGQVGAGGQGGQGGYGGQGGGQMGGITIGGHFRRVGAR